MGDESNVDSASLIADPAVGTEAFYGRERLLAAIALMIGIGLALALPFALKAGAEFFLPVTAALVIAVALVPLLEWLERRRVPSALAALFCVVLFLAAANLAMASIILPASDWFALLPDRVTRIRSNLGPILDIYSSLQKFINDTTAVFVRAGPHHHTRTVTIETPNTLLDLIATTAPFAIIQMFFAILVIFFFLSGWTRMRNRTLANSDSMSAVTTASVIQRMVDATSTYLATITVVNFSLGGTAAIFLWWVKMPTPVMWGGLVAILNYVPYLGPIAAAVLLALGGLMTFVDPWYAMVPALIFVALHLLEANFLTPLLVGRRLTINPLLILISLSYWGWVWGATGAILAVPLLIIAKTVLDAAGKPDIAGFLFEDGTLMHGERDRVGSA